MEYKEIRAWFKTWLESNQHPVQLYWSGCKISPDVRVAVTQNINEIDTLIQNRTKPAMILARTKKEHLLEIKKALENKQHDLSQWGYTA
jgi:hypothetical protein